MTWTTRSCRMASEVTRTYTPRLLRLWLFEVCCLLGAPRNHFKNYRKQFHRSAPRLRKIQRYKGFRHHALIRVLGYYDRHVDGGHFQYTLWFSNILNIIIHSYILNKRYSDFELEISFFVIFCRPTVKIYCSCINIPVILQNIMSSFLILYPKNFLRFKIHTFLGTASLAVNWESILWTGLLILLNCLAVTYWLGVTKWNNFIKHFAQSAFSKYI
jgi:hypothetical protein